MASHADPRSWTAVFVLVMTLIAGCGVADGKSSVDIVNFLTEPMWVHCKARWIDLKWQFLQQQQDYSFEFHENLLLGTAYHCRFEWGQNGKMWQECFVWDREHPSNMPLKCGKCVWRAYPDGLYIWNKITQNFQLAKTWETNGIAPFANFSTQVPWEKIATPGPAAVLLPDQNLTSKSF